MENFNILDQHNRRKEDQKNILPPCPAFGQSTEDIEDQEKDYVCLNLLNYHMNKQVIISSSSREDQKVKVTHPLDIS
jgi:hypothetical protein